MLSLVGNTIGIFLKTISFMICRHFRLLPSLLMTYVIDRTEWPRIGGSFVRQWQEGRN